MKKIMLMSLAVSAALNAADVNSEPNAGHVSGQIRAAYVGNDYDAGGNDYATALGGVLKYETRTWNGFKLGAAAYASQKADFATGKDSKANGDFLDENKKSYAYVGEVDMGFAGIEGLSISTLYGIFKSAALETRIKEWDLILAYELSEMITVDASYAVINDCYDNADGGSDAGYRRALVRANFNF